MPGDSRLRKSRRDGSSFEKGSADLAFADSLGVWEVKGQTIVLVVGYVCVCRHTVAWKARGISVMSFAILLLGDWE